MSKSIRDVVDKLVHLGVLVFVDKGKLKTKCKKEALTDEVKNLIKFNKQEIIEFLTYEEKSSDSGDITPVRASDEGYLLSFSQRRLWFADLYQNGHSQYNVSTVFNLTGDLNVGALTNALKSVIARHEILRTVFTDCEGEPRQVVCEEFYFDIPLTDLSDLDEIEVQDEVENVVVKESLQPFDLKQDLMIRAKLLRLSTENHVLVATVHHIAADGWSVAIIFRELVAFYKAGLINDTPILPPLDIQYKDYACWQRGYDQNISQCNQVVYWREKLSNLPVVHNFPLDYSRPKIPSLSGGKVVCGISKDSLTRFRDICDQSRATLFMGLHAVFSIMLSRYSGNSDIVIGSPVANREQKEIANLIGFFVNTLVLRTDVRNDQSFVELLRQCKQTAIDAYTHQQTPFEQIVELLRPERSQSFSPLFQIMLVLQNNEESVLELPNLKIEHIAQEQKHSKYDLTLNVEENEDGLDLSWIYSKDIFNKSTVERMSKHFQLLFDCCIEYSNEPLGTLSILSERERFEQIHVWNRPVREEDTHLYMHSLFEKQAQFNPDAPAVICEDNQISYNELNSQTNQLARYLVTEREASPDKLIGICIDRSIEWVLAALSILKSGAAYVPLDPSLPVNRLEYILEDANIDTVITLRGFLENFSSLSKRTLCLDDPDLHRGICKLSSANLNLDSSVHTPNNLAYVIYTSGSTGQPKGVQIEHRSIVNYLLWAIDYCEISELDGSVVCSSLQFDLAVTGLFPTLSSGKKLILGAVGSEIETLVNHLTNDDRFLFKLTPSHLDVLKNSSGLLGQSYSRKSHIFVIGGETLSINQKDDWENIFPNCRMINHYGPTETSVGCCVFDVKDQFSNDLSENVPIGRPIDNTQLYILDSYMQPLPIGCIGEICISGSGVSRGYLNLPTLTDEKFISNPFTHNDGKLYRTGDLGRWLPSGEIEFLGRTDNQVKFRGYRIELSDIENALLSHESVRESLVVSEVSSGGDSRLVAYVVANLGDDFRNHKVKQERFACKLYDSIIEKLPPHMLPSGVVFLDAFPLTANGKRDRSLLPRTGLIHFSGVYAAPETEVEHVLCDIWRQSLGVDRVGVSDNFFRLGGHSLLATRVIAEIYARINVSMSLKEFFSCQSLRDLAELIEQTDLAISVPQINKVNRDSRLLLSHSQKRLWFIDQMEPGTAQYNMPAVLRLKGVVDVEALGRAFSTIVRRHEVLRTNFVLDDDEPVQVVQNGEQFQLLEVDLTNNKQADREQEVVRRIKGEISTGFDLAEDLMFRAQLLKLTKDEYVLLTNMHHIASDGWSVSILLRELCDLYNAYSKGERSELPDLAIQYADFAQWQRKILQGDTLEHHSRYWKDKLSNLPSVHNLPLDHPRPLRPSHIGKRVISTLSIDVFENFSTLCEQEGATLFMGLNAALSVLLARYSGESDIVIGSPIANREQHELKDIIGFFANTLVLRNDISGNPSFLSVLGESRNTALDAFEHQCMPFEHLVELLQPKRNSSYSPLFQIMLVLQNNENVTLDFPGLDVSIEAQQDMYAKFDLTINAKPVDTGLQLSWEYDSQLFDRRSIENIAHSFKNLITSIIDTPHKPVYELSILDSEQQKQQLVEWNATQVGYSGCQYVHQLFEEHAKNFPDAVALVFGDTSVTYSELNKKANQIAHFLRNEVNVRPDDLIGVFFDRSINMMVTILGVLKAGAAYVPLDPKYPMDRLSYMASNSGLKLIVTQGFRETGLPLDGVVQSVCFDDHGFLSLLKTLPVENPELSVPLETNSLAYVVYTSGSTGRPKGVMVTHEGLLNLVHSQVECFKVQPESSVLQFASMSFDAAVSEWAMALCSGARLVLIESQEPDVVEAQIQKHNVTHATLPPALLPFLDKKRLDCINCLIVAGEQCRKNIADEWSANRNFYNAYGPSEYSVCTTIGKYTTGDAVLHMGKPINNTHVYVLNRHLEIEPPGVVGELYIGGSGLARGYINNPDLTNERFIPHPFSDQAGERLYKTGDLVRWLPDGNLEFVGRADNQLKIRGFRVELEEIENALVEEESIEDAVVLASSENDNRIIAYLVVNKMLFDENIPVLDHISSWRTHLSKTLPEYMLPSAFIVLESIPLTQNGKVDRRALPEPKMNHIAPSSVSAKTDEENAMSDIWKNVLGISELGVTDNFFDLGGHSLMAVQLTRSIKKELNKDVSIRILMENPTIRKLIEAVSESRSTEFRIEALTPDVANRYQPFPLTDVQQAYWMGRKGDFELGNIGTSGYMEIPFEDLDVNLFQETLNTLIKRHDMLRMVVLPDGQQCVFESVPVYEVEVTDVRHLEQDEKTQARLEIRKDMSAHVYSGEDWPLFNLRICRMTERTSVVHFSMDALVVDAASSRILSHEFNLLYSSPNVALPDLELRFRDYVIAQRCLESSEIYKESKSYWLNRLDNFPSKPELPLAVDPSSISNPRFERRSFHIQKDKWETLKSIAGRSEVTPTTLILGCLGEVLSLWSENSHFALNLTLFNRVPFHPQVNSIIGDFTTLTLLEMDYRERKQGFIESLRMIQKQLWTDLEYRYFGGMEMLSELRRQVGQPVSYPVVVTSTLGLEIKGSADSKLKESSEEQGRYSLSQTSQIWLDVQLSETDGSLKVVWDSVKGLFPEGMLDDMFECFISQFEYLSQSPDAWLDSLPIEIPEAQRKLIESVNDTSEEVVDELLHSSIREQFAIRPDKVAVYSKGKSLTYKELGTRVSYLSRCLLNGGAKVNGLVAVVMEKGWEQIVAVVGILESGAAYLPIEASWPQERISDLLRSGEVSQVVTTPECVEMIPKSYTVHVIDSEMDQSLWEAFENRNLGEIHTAKPHDLAYVIFTSGSTGKPKGVMIDHRGALNTVVDINRRYHVTDKDTIFGISNLSFDLSVYDIFGVLGAGGTLILPLANETRDPQAWLNYIDGSFDDHKVTLWNSVPALVQMLVESCEGRDKGRAILGLRLILMSGDWIPTELPERIQAIANSCDVISLGGATEASIWSIYFPIGDVEKYWRSIPYGKALANQTFYVLNEGLSFCPIHTVGDLFIGGVGLAKGYWKDTEKTNASFFLHPVTGERLYKTGDRGRLMADGNIEFMGRVDRQVKIQGYRIELGEIQNRIVSHPRIEDAIVTVREVNKTKTLVAYAVPSEDDTRNDIDGGNRANKGPKVDKINFRFSQKGVRNGDSGSRIKLSKDCDGDIVITPRSRKYVGAGKDRSTIACSSLGGMLRGFYRRKYHKDQVLPKAHYPSGGTLYPVQVYVEICLDQTLFDGGRPVLEGFYYYHPLDHELIYLGKIDNPDSKRGVYLHFIADLSAIEPVYKDLSLSLCHLEFGYMSQLLETVSCSGVFAQECDSSIRGNRTIPGISDSHVVLGEYRIESSNMVDESEAQSDFSQSQVSVVCSENNMVKFQSNNLPQKLSLSPNERKSYRKYLNTSPSLDRFMTMLSMLGRSGIVNDDYLEIFINVRNCMYLNSGEFQVDEGLYKYDCNENSLSIVGKNIVEDDIYLFNYANFEMEYSSSFGVFFVSKGCDYDRELKVSGMLGQALYQYAPKLNIGLCAIGKTNEDNVKKHFGLSDSDRIVHSFIGGEISDSQVCSMVEEDSGGLDNKQSLTRYLEYHLPYYMVPSDIIPIQKIPLTSNGKVDHSNLPEPDFGSDREGYVPPKNDVELTLCEIWEDLLGRDEVGTADNFYFLGGNSLLITRMQASIKKQFGVNIPLAIIFSDPKVSVLAIHISNAISANKVVRTPELEHVEEVL